MTEAQLPPPFETPPLYLGDGVYASTDGWHIQIAVGIHTNHVVSLDRSVLASLFAYAKKAGLL